MRASERTMLIFVAVASLAGGAARAGTAQPAGPAALAAAGDLASEVTKLKGEIEGLKGMVPDQSHVMKDIAYHFSNLWFAGQARNWPLAGFYLSETRSHLRWAIRVRPVRLPTTGELDLLGIFDGVDRSMLAAM